MVPSSGGIYNFKQNLNKNNLFLISLSRKTQRQLSFVISYSLFVIRKGAKREELKVNNLLQIS
jgi:hypothetical protein